MSAPAATANGTATRTAAEWVEAFAEGWRAPADAESFCDHFDEVIADDIRLVQPQLPMVTGKRAFREEFARPLFELLSDVRGSVESWAARPDGDGELLFVELTIRAKLPGGRPVTLRTTDKVTLRGGLATERVASLDPLELLGAVARSPRAWPRFARIQTRRLQTLIANRRSR